MRYFCLDDVAESQHSGLSALRTAGRKAGLEISYSSERVSPDGELVSLLANDPPDGVLLDLLLTFHTGGASTTVSHAHAQAIRDAVLLDKLPDVPIVLWSSAQKLDKYYQKEPTAYDLYDQRFDKAGIADRRGAEYAVRKMMSLSRGYATIGKKRDLGEDGIRQMVALTKREYVNLDLRIFDRYRRFTDAPAHDYARFIKTQLLGHPRPIVNERLLAARMGISIDDVGSGWERVKEAVGKFRYKGVFGDGWDRWWWGPTEAWLQSLGFSRPVFDVPASERVQKINKEVGVRLEPAAPIDGCHDERYWGVCERTNRPVALSDALESAMTSELRWHDARYISKPQAMRRLNEVAVVDRQRLRAQ